MEENIKIQTLEYGFYWIHTAYAPSPNGKIKLNRRKLGTVCIASFPTGLIFSFQFFSLFLLSSKSFFVNIEIYLALCIPPLPPALWSPFWLTSVPHFPVLSLQTPCLPLPPSSPNSSAVLSVLSGAWVVMTASERRVGAPGFRVHGWGRSRPWGETDGVSRFPGPLTGAGPLGGWGMGWLHPQRHLNLAFLNSGLALTLCWELVDTYRWVGLLVG